MENKPTQTYIPGRVLETDYPLIDNDPHFKRVIGYARPTDCLWGLAAATIAPGGLWLMEKVAPSYVGRGGLPKAFRLASWLGISGGFLLTYQLSSLRFYGVLENKREIEMDMTEMVDKVKRGEPLYGVSSLTPNMQGVAARQSRYSAVFFGVMPWFNFVNHNQHGVDTAKYYQQAETELEAERLSKQGSDPATAEDKIL
ncbi:NADH-ubiquinone oxidoreductase 20.9 kDa subunit [Zalerion maritima]|uniref:NADH-ubiquinone oxidoreductase 20.9 kDa subunit n=1 Tax=Zalerion maritima TaxID=339359 RepID=A0AAD5RK72_9PEZI|nr:NADH-ubiquinone oxidoreductase 20.9 kDa subunit [Zalerion maritima]